MYMAAIAGERRNIIHTIKTYGRQLSGFIRSRVSTREDAEDILQDVWYQLSNLPDTAAIENISGWLYRVAKNRIIDKSRKKKERVLEAYEYESDEGTLHFADFLPADNQTPETAYLRELFWEELFEALGELPEEQRQVFIWNELEDMTLQEIADRQQEKLKTVISRKRYAVEHLRRRLENLYNDIINY